jgi:hypothetical protein
LAIAHEHPLAAISDTSDEGFVADPLHGLDETSVADYAALRCPPASGEGERLPCARLIHEQTGNLLFASTRLTIWPHVAPRFA